MRRHKYMFGIVCIGITILGLLGGQWDTTFAQGTVPQTPPPAPTPAVEIAVTEEPLFLIPITGTVIESETNCCCCCIDISEAILPLLKLYTNAAIGFMLILFALLVVIIGLLIFK